MTSGESYKTIVRLWVAEFVSAALLFTLPKLLDSYFIAQLHSRSTYGALGYGNNILEVLTKLAESISVAGIAVIGAYNGAKEYEKAGESLGDVFWTSIIAGLIPLLIISCGASQIYAMLNVPANMVAIGAPFLRLRAIGSFLSFIYLGFFGFFRGVKNTLTPMLIYIAGISLFIICDYALVLGKLGMPSLGLVGSAIAAIVQYSVMIVLCVWYITCNLEYRIYFRKAFYRFFNPAHAWHIIMLGLPIMIDKASLAYSYVYLASLISPLGKNAIAAFTSIRDIQQLAFLPALGFATVLTFLVSNNLGARHDTAARNNIRKTLFLAMIGVGVLLTIICLNPTYIVSFFDPRNKFSDFTAQVLPFLGVLVIGDLVQVIFAAALRGAGDVMAVMWIRAISCVCVFAPLATYLSSLAITPDVTKCTLLYSTLYLAQACMAILFYYRLRGSAWLKHREVS